MGFSILRKERWTLDSNVGRAASLRLVPHRHLSFVVPDYWSRVVPLDEVKPCRPWVGRASVGVEDRALARPLHLLHEASDEATALADEDWARVRFVRYAPVGALRTYQGWRDGRGTNAIRG